MASTRPLYQFLFVFALTCGCASVETAAASACVWKITGPKNATLYLGGSFHVLRSIDYPLPSAYNRAFDASTRLVFEADPKDLEPAARGFFKQGIYPKGDSLKNHVDPRTYDYLRRLFAIQKVPMEKIATFRPWFLAMLIESASLEEKSPQLGVEQFLARRARANSKPVSGLESVREGVELYSKLSDRESEAQLLLLFIPLANRNADFVHMVEAWRRGDVELLARVSREASRDFPSLNERIIDARNRKWMPKIEGFLRSGITYFVVVGAGHLGGPGGLLPLLKARGYQLEQL